MTKILQEMLERVQSWSESRQEDAVEVLKGMEAQDKSDLHLTEEQLAEVRRRRAKSNTAYISLAEARKRFRTLGV
jgi:hypothetical protein